MAELNFGLLTPPGSQSIGNAFAQGMDQAAVARAQENQNALAQYTLGKAKREDELTNQLLGDLRNAKTPEEIYRAYQRAGKPEVASKMQSEALTQDELRGKILAQPGARARTDAETAKLQSEAKSKAIAEVASLPDAASANAAIDTRLANKTIDQSMADEMRQGLTPENFPTWKHTTLMRLSTPVEQLRQSVVTTKDTDRGGFIERQAYNAQGVAVGAPIILPKTPTPGSVPGIAQAATAAAIARDQGVDVPGAAPAPVTPAAAPAQAGAPVTPTTFPRVAPQVQTQRNNEQIALLNAELAKSNPADQQRIRAEIAKLSTGNPFAAAGGDPSRPATVVNNLSGAQTVNAMNAPSPREIREARTPKFDATAGGYVYPPSAENPQGRFVPVSGLDGKPLNESQGNATAYGLRMKEAQAILDNLANPKTGNPTLRGAAVENIPLTGGAIGKILPSFLGGTSEQQQQVKQAKSNFITAVLRKESGAVISDSEFAREDEKYFPQFNDSQKVIKQKEDARNLAITAMKFQAGPGAKEIDKYVPSISREKTAPNLSEPPAGAVRVKAK